MAEEGLNVIALISGGKDSFYSLLHCIHHGHRVVALANLLPATEGQAEEFQIIDPAVTSIRNPANDETNVEQDLNSFMYQTVGHEIISLYASATGLPLYRQPIRGGAQRHERDYTFDPDGSNSDETESMTSLLKDIMERHPEANAVSAGAILSTYQRTRVESVALRLGLTPLAYLWKYPVLPSPVSPVDDAQLLKDMAESGLEARIIKVASAGLSDDHLWERVTSVSGAERVKSALRKFGASGGAVLGEGGEFETLVLDGPSRLFGKRITVAQDERQPVQEGGGTSWLKLLGARVEEKSDRPEEPSPRVPSLFDSRFQDIVGQLSEAAPLNTVPEYTLSTLLGMQSPKVQKATQLLYCAVKAGSDADCSSIEPETAAVVSKIRDLLAANSLEPQQVSNTVIILRHMSEFPKVNAQYGKLFAGINPPSRVTISCGELLPARCSIVIYLTVDTTPVASMDRQGLHVQSRSYWAPANIGPYSQAISIPISSGNSATGLRSWSIAGQIPLIPSLMLLPAASPESQRMQIVLSLQHLWRIGVDLQVQFWTSAVAFFARSSSDVDMQRNAKMAGQAWRLAHGSPEDEDDADEGPDPWDLKFNTQYMTMAGSDAKSQEKPLPDWTVTTLRQQNEPDTCVPPVFSVEVEELPRQAGVEWHAHIGLSQLEEASIETLHAPNVGNGPWGAWHTVARGSEGIFLHTLIARSSTDDNLQSDFKSVQDEMSSAYQEALKFIKVEDAQVASDAAYLTYVDISVIRNVWSTGSDELDSAIIPCRSIWSETGKRHNIIGLWRILLK